MNIRGKAWNYGDNINTDFMFPGRYLELIDPKEIAKHAMEGIDSTFVNKVQKGDILVGGRNIGLGSSREQAPLALKYSGVGAVVAESFARIFYRNAFNVGLPAIECPGVSKMVKTGDEIEMDTTAGAIIVNWKEKLKIKPLPEFMVQLLNEGGLVPYIKKHMDEW